MPVIERYIDSLVDSPARVGIRGGGLRDPLGRRGRHRPGRAQRARTHLPLGPGRRRRRRAAGRQARRLRERDHLRHGRDERRPRARARWRADPRARVAGRLEHPDPLPGHRPGRDRRRGRHDRLGRHGRLAARRARRAPAPIRVRPASARATRSRRSPTPTCSSGRLNPETYLGGDLEIRPDLAEQAIERLAEQLGLSAPQTASGILRIANANMTSATHLISVERGHDPRDFALVAGGGAGPLHAVEIARELRIPQVVVPPTPGVTSALGILQVDLRHDLLAPVLQQVKQPRRRRPWQRRSTRLDRRGAPRSSRRRTIPDDRRSIELSVDARYYGQTPYMNLKLETLSREPGRRRGARRPVQAALRVRVRLPAPGGRGHRRDRQRPRRRDRADRGRRR